MSKRSLLKQGRNLVAQPFLWQAAKGIFEAGIHTGNVAMGRDPHLDGWVWSVWNGLVRRIKAAEAGLMLADAINYDAEGTCQG